MELIQKRIMRIMTTGTTTGCTPCAVIIPNLNVNYYFKISVTAESQDIGFFDANSDYSGYGGYGGYGGNLIQRLVVTIEPIGLNNLI